MISTVRRLNGDVYTFRYYNNQWQLLHPVPVAEETVDGWKFIDSDGLIETHDEDGKSSPFLNPQAERYTLAVMPLAIPIGTEIYPLHKGRKGSGNEPQQYEQEPRGESLHHRVETEFSIVGSHYRAGA